MNKMEQEKIQEMQILEQRLQNTILQKQAFQMESAETTSALEELEKSGDEVFKIIGQLMIKTEKPKIKEELLNKQKILELRIKSFEKQENSLTLELQKIQEEIKEKAIKFMAKALTNNSAYIIEENKKDVEYGQGNGLSQDTEERGHREGGTSRV